VHVDPTDVSPGIVGSQRESRHVTFVLVENWLLYPKYVLLSNGKTRMKPAVNIPQQLFGVPVSLVVKAQTLVIGTSISWRNGAHESG